MSPKSSPHPHTVSSSPPRVSISHNMCFELVALPLALRSMLYSTPHVQDVAWPYPSTCAWIRACVRVCVCISVKHTVCPTHARNAGSAISINIYLVHVCGHSEITLACCRTRAHKLWAAARQRTNDDGDCAKMMLPVSCAGRQTRNFCPHIFALLFTHIYDLHVDTL